MQPLSRPPTRVDPRPRIGGGGYGGGGDGSTWPANGAALTAALLVDLPFRCLRHRGPAVGPTRVEAALRSVRPAWRWSRTATRCFARTALGRLSGAAWPATWTPSPIADNVASRVRDGGRAVHGCGTSDMKSGVAVLLRLGAALAAAPGLADDLTLVCYDNEEVEATRNGLAGRVARTRPEWLTADLAILLEPTSGLVDARTN